MYSTMNKGVKKRSRPVVIVVTVIISIAAVFAAFLVVSSLITNLDGKYVYRSEKVLDLRDSGITDISNLMKLKDPEIIDLQGDPITVEQYETLQEKFPDCDIRWDVPLSSGSYSNMTEKLMPDSFTDADIELLKYLKQLTVVDFSNAHVSDEVLLTIRNAFPECDVVCNERIDDREYQSPAASLQLDGIGLSVDEFNIMMEESPQVKEVTVTDCGFSVDEQLDLLQRYPDVAFYWDVKLLGKKYDSGTKELSLGNPSKEELSELKDCAALLNKVERIDFGNSILNLEDICDLRNLFNGAEVNCKYQFLGRTISTSETELDFSGRKNIDISSFDLITAAMPNLSKVIMSDCGLPDETMDKLNHTYAGVRFVWTVYVTRYYPLRTDVTYFCASDRPNAGYSAVCLSDEEIQPLKYCTDMVAMDLGHMWYTNLDFVRDMKQLRYLVVSCCYITDISAVSELDNLYYFEMAFNNISDLTPLLKCKNLRFLNITQNVVYDREVLAKFGFLEWLWYQNYDLPEEDIEWIKNALPDTNCFITVGVPDKYAKHWKQLQPYRDMRDIYHMFY